MHAPRTREQLTCAIVSGSSYIHQNTDKTLDQPEMLIDEKPSQSTRNCAKQESTRDNELMYKGQSHRPEHTDIEHIDIEHTNREHSRAKSTSLGANREIADRLASALCHHLHMERDICLNSQLFGGSP